MKLERERQLVLGLETSNPSVRAGVALGVMYRGEQGRGEILALQEVGQHGGEKGSGRSGLEDDELMPAIAGVFQEAGVEPRDVDVVAVSAGPGGYTAVRVACAIGKMLAFAAGARRGVKGRCVRVPTFLTPMLAWAHGLDREENQPSADAKSCCVGLASKGDSAWVSPVVKLDQLRSGDLNAVADGFEERSGVMKAEDLEGIVKSAGGRVVLLTDDFFPAKMRERAAVLGMEVRGLEFDPMWVIAAAGKLREIEPEGLNPIYPREPEAVTLWRAKQKAK